MQLDCIPPEVRVFPLKGPGFQEVEDRYSVSWKDYISSSSMGIVFMSFDGRGTGFRGDEIMHMASCYIMVVFLLTSFHFIEKIVNHH